MSNEYILSFETSFHVKTNINDDNIILVENNADGPDSPHLPAANSKNQ